MFPAIPAGSRPQPTGADCQAVDRFWLTPDEVVFVPICDCLRPEDCLRRFGPLENSEWACVSCFCVPTNTPLVVHLPDYVDTGRRDPTWWRRGFCDQDQPEICLDWRDEGKATCTTWPRPESDIGFVVTLIPEDFQRLEQGIAVRVQPWRHLFGNNTMAPEGGFPFADGFEALAAHCGATSAEDGLDFSACESSLMIWQDRDADGRMEMSELWDFAALGIDSLRRLRETGKRDECGNEFPWEAHATCDGRPGRCGLWIDAVFAPREPYLLPQSVFGTGN